MLGLDPLPERTDLKATVAGVLDWRLGEEPWQAAERDEGAAAWELRVDPGDGTDAAGLHVRVDNAAGLVAERGPVVLPGRADPCGDDAGPLPVAAGADGGCGCGLAGARRQARWAVPGVLLRRR